MKRLKKIAYTKFEEEIRNPGPALKKAIEEMRGNAELEFEDAKPIIDKAIEQDIGWTRNDVKQYFDLYSDTFKAANGIRPHYDYTSDYYDTIYDLNVMQKKDSTNYSDYTVLENELSRQYEDEDSYHQTMNDIVDGVTVNDQPLTQEMIEQNDRELDENFDYYTIDLREEEFENAAPFQESFHK